jgi:acyl-CoA thioesterase FadM
VPGGKLKTGLTDRAATVLRLHSEPLRADWVDAYGHLNQSFYLIPFSNASWALQDRLGIGLTYFSSTAGAAYTVESHLIYRAEVRAPADLVIETVLLGATEHRLAFAHRMLVKEVETTLFETVVAHVDTNIGRTSPWPAATRDQIAQLSGSPPSWVVGSVSLFRRARKV